MKTKTLYQIIKDMPGRKITITRDFDAAPEQVWRAWTESELLDQWWAPQPWRAETRFMDFREGGHWLYAMVGPDNSRHYARVDFQTIDAPRSFTATDFFCDENGVRDTSLPGMSWHNEFRAVEDGTEVRIEITFERETDLQTIVEMGFEAGFTAALGQLERYLRKGFEHPKVAEPNTEARNK